MILEKVVFSRNKQWSIRLVQSENNERITFIKYLYGFKTCMDINICEYVKKYFGFTAVEKIKIICTFKPVNY